MEVDRPVKTLGAQLCGEAKHRPAKFPQPNSAQESHPFLSRKDANLVDEIPPSQHLGRTTLNEPAQMRPGKRAAQLPHRRQRANDIAEGTEPDHEHAANTLVGERRRSRSGEKRTLRGVRGISGTRGGNDRPRRSDSTPIG